MTDIPIETSPEAISTSWLSDVFRSSGAIGPEASLESFTFKPIGTGQMSNSFRITPTWAKASEAPKSFVIKLPSSDDGSRMAGESMRIYDVEVNFYKDFAPRLPMRTPFCHFSGINENKVDFVLVMEDVAPAEQGNQLEGCTLEQAKLAITEATKLHAPFLCDPVLRTTPWLNRNDSEMDFRPLLKGFYDGFEERYAGLLDDEIFAMGKRYFYNDNRFEDEKPKFFSLVHTDFRLDNMLFGTDAGGPPITIVDWQTVSCGNPLSDVSYFIGAGLVTEARRAHEDELVRLYHETMLSLGVKDYSWEQCWRDYRYHSFAGFTMAVMASMLVERTERGDEMFMAMARRHGHQILDLDAEALVPK